MPGIANDGSEDLPNDSATSVNDAAHKFDLKNPEHYNQAIDLMKAYEAVKNKSEEEMKAEYILIEMFNIGYKREVPGRWSQHFIEATEELKKKFIKENDPEYKEFLRLQKKFSLL